MTLERSDEQARLRQSADALLALDPDPVPRLRILRDLLDRRPGDPELDEAHAQVRESRWVQALISEQGAHGGWSRFHSMDRQVKHRIPTTEFAVRRALVLGLDPQGEVLGRTQTYLEGLLLGRVPWPEHQEPNDRWATGEELFVASTLAMLAPAHPLLTPVYEKWGQIASETFAEGTYDPEREWRAHCRLTGATTMRDSYLVLNNRYALTLLGCWGGLDGATARALVGWVWQHPRGVGYLDVPPATPLADLPGRRLWRWFESHQILSRFEAWHDHAATLCADLWSAQGPDGLWDFGPRTKAPLLALSESWRRPKDKAIDHSVWALLLLRRFCR